MSEWEPQRLRVTLTNRHGLHARPAHLFVQTANAYAAELRVGRTDAEERVDGKSIMGMMMLAAECGAELELCARGPDAEAQLRALKELLVSTGFECLSEHHFSLRQNPFGWVQSFLNKKTAWPRNGLYSMLHRREYGAGSSEPAVPWPLRMAFWLGMPLGLASSVIAAIGRNGATVHIRARAKPAGAREIRDADAGPGSAASSGR